jgi:aminoglycoside phosphotransferase
VIPPSASSATDADLERAVTSLLAEGANGRVEELTRRPSPYRSSFPLEEVEVRLKGGTSLRLMFKDLSPSALADTARSKPTFLHQPLREIETYRRILEPAALGPPRCYGAVVEPGLDRYWLFLEKVPGVELYQVGAFRLWKAVASWLADLHARFARAEDLAVEVPLLVHDSGFYAMWPERAAGLLGEAGRDEDRRRIQAIGRRYEEVIERLLSLPRTLIHGEFYASNVLVDERTDRPRVAPIDWELAAIGPGLMDLAALTTGWEGRQVRELVRAYREGAPGNPAVQQEGFRLDLACCRLHLAMQWLGWSAAWAPPPAHRRDWMAEARRAAEELEL